MARPRLALPPADHVRAVADAQGRIAVRVTPGARGEGLELEAGRLLARVRARPQDGAANEAVRALLAEALGIAASRLTLDRGATSREKLFRILS